MKTIIVLTILIILAGCHSPTEDAGNYSAQPFNTPSAWGGE